ncbi:class I SAM-dependent methyltransferase [Priestia flexa]|uniref:class I SAM-dependent methyltransferase n=1 Tax=Priestia flexa TaxID=86664 RepID=UPI0039B4AEB0
MNRTLSQSSFISSFGGNVMNVLSPQAGENILEIGSGNGYMANQLSSLGVNITGIDSSENMVEQSQHHYPHLQFMHVNALDLDYEDQFDAVFSKNTLHLIHPPSVVIKNIYRALRLQGRFVTEFNGKNHLYPVFNEVMRQLAVFNIISSDFSLPFYFPSIGEYTSLLEQHEFHVQSAIYFTHPLVLQHEDGLRNWLDTHASSLFKNITAETKQIIFNRVEDRLQETFFKHDEWYLPAASIRVQAVKIS